MNRTEASMITITYVDLLLTVLTACAVASTLALVFGMRQARSTMARVDSLLTRLEPLLSEVDRLSHEAEEAFRSVRELSNSAGEIARDVESVTSETRRVALPLIHDLADQTAALRVAMRHLVALSVGVKTGLSTLARSKP
jgi:methyl-accepting chemotaxis protein